jgi:hypothetical protein
MKQIAAMLMMSLLLMKGIWNLKQSTARRRMSGAAILMLNSKSVTMGPVLKK